ncbi:MAG TPA: S49 family peptidase [Acetobacteraceae bacterium]|jgi:ClpP class serine protease|nr:S49 family peptidase [Acetobacteraceae bacterium]
MSAPPPGEPLVPVVRIRGALTPLDGMTLDTIGPLIDRAFEMAGEGGAVVIDIDSPGGSPVQSELLSNRIRRRAAERNVRTVAVVGEICAAGGYWVACAADEIVAHTMSVVGLNGIIGVNGVLDGGFEVNEALSRVAREGWTASLASNVAGSFASASASGDEYGAGYYSGSPVRGLGARRQTDSMYAKRLLDDLQEQFRLWVQTRRGERLRIDATPIFSGSLVLGEQAMTIGLVDRLGDLETTIEQLGGESARPRIFSTAGGTTTDFVRFAMDAARAFIAQRVPPPGTKD